MKKSCWPVVLRLLTPACALLAAAVSQAQDYYNAAERRAATFSMFHGAPSGTDLSYYGDDYYQIIKTSNQTAAGFSGNSVVRGKNTENPALTAVSDYRRRFQSVNNPGAAGKSRSREEQEFKEQLLNTGRWLSVGSGDDYPSEKEAGSRKEATDTPGSGKAEAAKENGSSSEYRHCLIGHGFRIPEIILEDNSFKMDECPSRRDGEGCIGIWLGNPEIAVLNGSCSVFEESISFAVVNPQLVTGLYVEYVYYDDYLQLLLGVDGSTAKVLSLPDGLFPPETAGVCELGRASSEEPEIDIWPEVRSLYLKNRGRDFDEGDAFTLSLTKRLSVTGRGGGYIRLHLYYDSSRKISDERYANLECLSGLLADASTEESLMENTSDSSSGSGEHYKVPFYAECLESVYPVTRDSGAADYNPAYGEDAPDDVRDSCMMINGSSVCRHDFSMPEIFAGDDRLKKLWDPFCKSMHVYTELPAEGNSVIEQILTDSSDEGGNGIKKNTGSTLLRETIDRSLEDGGCRVQYSTGKGTEAGGDSSLTRRDISGERFCTVFNGISGRDDNCRIYREAGCSLVNYYCLDEYVSGSDRELLSRDGSSCSMASAVYECSEGTYITGSHGENYSENTVLCDSLTGYADTGLSGTSSGVSGVGGAGRDPVTGLDPGLLKMYSGGEDTGGIGEAALYLQALQFMQNDITCGGTGGADCRIFKGTGSSCRKGYFGEMDCCHTPNTADVGTYVRMLTYMATLKTAMSSLKNVHGGAGSWSNGPLLGSAQGLISSNIDSILGNVTETVSEEVMGDCCEALTVKLAELVEASMGTAARDALFTETVSEEGIATLEINPAVMGAMQGVMAAYVAYQLANTLKEIATSCRPEEIQTSIRLKLDSCTYQGRRCTKKVLGKCLVYTEEYCCYSSPLARIIMDGVSFKDRSRNKCEGIRLEEMSELNLEDIDLSEWNGYLDRAGLLSPDRMTLDNLTGSGSSLNMRGRLNSRERTEARLRKGQNLNGQSVKALAE